MAVAEYVGVLVEQLPGSPKLVLFSAPALDIDKWAGIPQRRRLAHSGVAVETAGFQREEKPRRVADIAAFMSEPKNVIQNPLLAAIQDPNLVEIESDDAATNMCRIKVVIPDSADLTLAQLVERAMDELSARLPELRSRPVDQAMLDRLRVSLSVEAPSQVSDPEDSDETGGEPGETESSVESGLALFDEESQVVDFYDELHARLVVLDEIGKGEQPSDAIGGFTREFLGSLIKPVVLVDGQHRLKGALRAAWDHLDSERGTERLAELIDAGQSPDEARKQLLSEAGRTLPISLLVSPDPAEHVFQFVVVNQKATAMSNALLGTIVSTSLTQDEMDPIRARLRDAGIELEGSRAIAYLSRASDSPFRGLVATGISGDRPNALPWTVLGGLVSIVRNLQGVEPYSAPKVDYARLWRDRSFALSRLVDTELPSTERLAIWSAVDGPWRMLFLKLFNKIRDRFGSDDPNTQNYWGSTRSNLFNMVSLRILTADFFNFIKDRPLHTPNDVDLALEEWIGDLNPTYFARDWRMVGTKKDQPAIKQAWSEAWAEFRLTQRLPRVERYNPGGRGAGH